MTFKQIAIGTLLVVLSMIAYVAIHDGMHRDDLVFRTALQEADGNINGALKRLGLAWCDQEGNLVRLNLSRTITRTGKAIGRPAFQLDNRVLAHVTQVDTIRFLALGHETRINDAGMKQIAEMKNLEWLSMKQTQISAVGLSHLKTAKKLRFIIVSDANLTEAEAHAFERAKPGCQVFRWPTDAVATGMAVADEHNQFMEDVRAGRLVPANDFPN